MYKLIKSAIAFAFVFFAQNVFSQTIGTCPVTNYYQYFDPNCDSYIKTPEEIRLGQARVFMKDHAGRQGRCTFLRGVDLYIPQNRPGWAIALAHTHRSMSNLMGGEYLSINHLYATAFQESWFMGTQGEVWDASLTNSIDKIGALGCSFSVNNSDGYFHTDANGRIFLTEIYPTRFPNDAAAAPFVLPFEANIHLAMCWINGFFRIRQYGYRLDMQGFFENAADPYAATKLTAGSYVAGQGIPDVTNIVGANRATTIVAPDIIPFITNGAANTYAFYVSAYTKSLDTPIPIVEPGYESSNHQWYDYQMTWQDVSEYIDKICPFYIEVNCGQARAAVKEVFDAQNNGQAISFRYQFSPVIDALTVNFPSYEPEVNSTQYTTYRCNYPCKLPYPTISNDTPLEFCQGLSVDLTTIVGTGYQYEWYRDGVIIPNSNNIIFTATESGVYTVKITDPQGCSLMSNCPVTVRVNQCSSCDLTANNQAQNVKCTGYGNGSINVQTSGETGPFIYRIQNDQVNYTQSTSLFQNLIEGNYFITVYQQADTTCKAFTSARIDADNTIYHRVDITPNITECDEAELTAVVSNNPPSSCDFVFERISTNQWADWPADILSVSLVANGSQELYNSTSRNIFSTNVTIPNGASLSVVVKNIGVSAGSSGSDRWTFNIKRPDGTTVATHTVNPSTSFQKGSTIIIQPFVATCVFAQPNFTFTWSPAANVSNTSGLSTTATVTQNTYVYITGANPATPECPLKDSVLVRNTCNNCEAPSTIPTFIGESASVCAPLSDATIEANVPAGLYYQLFQVASGTLFGQVAQSAANGIVEIENVPQGLYRIRIATNVEDINNAACFTESTQSFAVNIISKPATPTIEGDLSVCLGEPLILTAMGNYSNANYTWNTPSNADMQINGAEISKTITSLDNSGIYQVVVQIATCESDPANVNVQINPLPLAQIQLPDTQNQSVCSGEEVEVEIRANGGNGPWQVVYRNDDGVEQDVLVPTEGSFRVTIAASQTITLVSVTDTQSSCANDVTDQQITFTISQDIDADVIAFCTDKSPFYQLRVNITQGDIIDPATSFDLSVLGISWTETSPSSGVWESTAIDESIISTLNIVNANACEDKLVTDLNQRCSCPITATLAITDGFENKICSEASTSLTVDITTDSPDTATDYEIILEHSIGTQSVTISSPLSSHDFEVTATGIYTVRVVSRGDDACFVSTNSVEIVHYEAPTVRLTTPHTTSDLCENNWQDVSIEVAIIGGDSPFSFELYNESSGIVDRLITNAGTYSVSQGIGNYILRNAVYGSANCVLNTANIQGNVRIDEKTKPLSNPTITGVVELCAQEQTTYLVSGLNQEDEYQWVTVGLTALNDLEYSYTAPNVSVEQTILLEGEVYNECFDVSGSITKQIGDNKALLNLRIKPVVTPMIDQVVIQGNGSCVGTEVIITVSAINAGAQPTYYFNGLIASDLPSTYRYIPSQTETIEIRVEVDENDPSVCFSRQAITENRLIEVANDLTPTVSIIPQLPTVCKGELTEFTAQSTNQGVGARYVWRVNGIDQLNDLTSFATDQLNDNDEIEVVMHVEGDCYTVDSAKSNTRIRVINVEEPAISIQTTPAVICQGEYISLNVIMSPSVEANYQWYINETPYTTSNNTSVLRSNTFKPSDQIRVEAIIETPCGTNQVSSQTLTLAIIPLPIAIINNGEKQLQLEEPNDLFLSAENSVVQGENIRYQWYTTDLQSNESLLTPNEIATKGRVYAVDTRYELQVEQDGCVDTTHIWVKWQSRLSIPTAFSPNGDNNHDYFEIQGIDKYRNAVVSIFNQWGEEVYTSGPNYIPWNGTRNGKEVSVSTYYYTINFNDPDVKSVSGYITLIR